MYYDTVKTSNACIVAIFVIVAHLLLAGLLLSFLFDHEDEGITVL
jgi:hypothetical protein